MEYGREQRKVRGRRLAVALVALGAVLSGLPTGTAAAWVPRPLRHLDDEGHTLQITVLKLQGSNGYRIDLFAISEREDGRGRIYIGATRKRSLAAYSAPAIVSEGFLRANLRHLGKVDLAFNPSGREKTIPIRCGRGSTYTYEPGTYEGLVEFEGEEGFTRARATQLPLLPLYGSVCGSGSGYGESVTDGLPGARIRGISYARGRTLSFQVNKNHPRSRAFFTAEIRERRRGITVYRSVEGVSSPRSFRFDPRLRTARLGPPSPFSGLARLRRDPNSYSPIWSGNLAIDFPGRSDVPLAARQMHVSLVHACFTRSNRPSIRTC